jgi:hypothetical protein
MHSKTAGDASFPKHPYLTSPTISPDAKIDRNSQASELFLAQATGQIDGHPGTPGYCEAGIHRKCTHEFPPSASYFFADCLFGEHGSIRAYMEK